MERPATSPRRRTTRRPIPRPGDGVGSATLDPRVVELLARFRVVFGATREHNRAVERACGISGPALRAIAVVCGTPGLRVTELARALLVRQPTASRIIDELVDAGLLRKRRARADQRAVELHPTAGARRILAAAPGPALGVLPAALAAMPTEELARLEASLDALIARLAMSDQAARYEPIAQL